MYPLASLEQLSKTPSAQDSIPFELEEDLRAYGCKLIHQAGILLKQKQVAVATAQILFQRFYYVSSLKHYGVADIGMGALFLASKLEECPLRMRDLINVYDVLLKQAAHSVKYASSLQSVTFEYEPMSYFGETFYGMRDALVVSEMQVLKRLGFNTSVALPYGTLVNYMRLLDLTGYEHAISRAWGYLNDALQTPVYALYSIPTIVSAAILLTAQHLSIPLPSEPSNPWWELFDADLEDVRCVSGYIMRLYRERTSEQRLRVTSLLGRKEIRAWLEARDSGALIQ